METDEDPGPVPDLQISIMRLSGEEISLKVPKDLSLVALKQQLVARDIIRERLATEFLLEGQALDQRSSSKLFELGVVDGSVITVVAKRIHDYSRITELEKLVDSERWPQGVLTTAEGRFYVCHFQGELLVFTPEMVLDQKHMLPREVSNPSQMAMSADGDLVFCCTRNGASVSAAVVDEQTMQVKRWIGSDLGGRGLGMALSEGVVYLSSISSRHVLGSDHWGSDRRGCVVAFDFHTGERIRSYGPFTKPSGLCVTEDLLLVADRGGDEVGVFSLDGTARPSIGTGELKQPNDVAVDQCGNILVMDTGNERVAVFSPEGELLASLLPGTFKNRGNTHSYISVNFLTGAISVSMDDIHKVAVLAPPI